MADARHTGESPAVELEEPAVNMELGGFSVNMEDENAGEGNAAGVPDAQGQVSGAPEDSE